MEKIVTPRRMTTAQTLLFTGELGEITIDTDKETLVIHDGVRAGGFPLARENLSNTLTPMLEDKGIAMSDLANVDQEAIAARGVAKTDMGNVSVDSIADLGLLKADCSNGIDRTSETDVGLVRLATVEESIASAMPDGAGLKAISLAGAKAMMQKEWGLPQDYLAGFEIRKVSGTEVEFGRGSAKSSDSTVDIVTQGPIVKSIADAWEQGSNMGGMIPGVAAAANAKYYAFAVRAGATGDVDILFDPSPDGEGILASPTVNGWSGGSIRLRAIGNISTDASGNIASGPMTGYRMDFRNASMAGMPSAKCVSIAAKASGNAYVQGTDFPNANGYIYLGIKGSNGNKFAAVSLLDEDARYGVASTSTIWDAPSVLLPVYRNLPAPIDVWYTGAVHSLKFIYAQGES
jgi:hypothetical protein